MSTVDIWSDGQYWLLRVTACCCNSRKSFSKKAYRDRREYKRIKEYKIIPFFFLLSRASPKIILFRVCRILNTSLSMELKFWLSQYRSLTSSVKPNYVGLEFHLLLFLKVSSTLFLVFFTVTLFLVEWCITCTNIHVCAYTPPLKK
jgi:hypothetical protein